MALYRSGESGNKKGRPPGRLDRRHRLRNLIDSHADELVTLAIAQARAGDMQALGLLLARAIAPVRAEAAPVAFARPVGTSASDWARSVLAAVADGQLAPDTGKHLIDAIAAVANITAIDEIEARVARLENGEIDDET